jgi:hypothetical protein
MRPASGHEGSLEDAGGQDEAVEAAHNRQMEEQMTSDNASLDLSISFRLGQLSHLAIG